MASGLRVTVDARPLDLDHLRDQGIGRYAHGLLDPLGDVARERGGELVLLRQGPPRPAAFAGGPTGERSARVRRLRVPPRLAELPEQVLLPLDIRRVRPGLHHSLSPYRAPLRPGVPHVMTIHDLIPLLWPAEYLRTGLAHRMLYAAARRARLLIAVSRATRRDIEEHLGVPGERLVVVPEAADERFAPADPRPVEARLGLSPPYVVCVGGLGSPDPRRNLTRLVDAFGDWTAAGERPETLVMAGRIGATGEALAARARERSLRVALPGFVPDEHLPGLLSGARCLVLPSRYEGFGLPALEAIACGTPVVAFDDAGAVPEVAGPGCATARPGDFTDLMRTIARVCDEHGLRDRLASDGLQHARRFSWRRSAELTWDAYERAYGGGSSP